MKKLSLALIALGMVSTTFAALPATTDPTLVSVPQLPGGFFLGGTAFYLQPSANNGDLDFAILGTGTIAPFHSLIKSHDPDYDWGWGVNVGYIFPQTGNDVAVNYWHVGIDNTDSVFGPGFFSAIFPITFTNQNVAITDFALLTNHLFSKLEFDFDQGDISFGQFIDVGCRLILHPTVGIQYTRIDQGISSNLAASASGVDSGVAFSFPVISSANLKSDFDGIGPRIGMDGTYYLGAGFGLAGHFAAALLVGDLDSKLTAFSSEAGGDFQGAVNIIPPLTVQNSFSLNSTRRIVPNLQGKLGVDYTYMFNNAANSYVTLEVGYQVDEYFNALDYLRSSGNFNTGPDDVTINYTTGPVRHRTADFDFSGAYANLTVYL